MTTRSKQLKSVSGMLVSGGVAATAVVMLIAIRTIESLPECQVIGNIGWFAMAVLSGLIFVRRLGGFLSAARSGLDPRPPFEYRPDDRELPTGTRTDVVRNHGE